MTTPIDIILITCNRIEKTRVTIDELYKRFFSTTTHVDLTNSDLWEVANELGIPKERVHFTNMSDKAFYFEKNLDFLWHLDDDWVENRQILKRTKARVKAVSAFGNPNWRQKCERILKKHESIQNAL